MDPAFSIPAFYSGKSVFITGATGFLGKVLVEKLLRSCPDIEKLFLLMRPKKGANTRDRLQQMITNPLFDTLRQKQPRCFDKIILVEGDIGLEGLGLSTAHRDMLIEKTSVIFHIAAEVKFDNTLKDAVLKNVRSTRDICILGERMKYLTALVYISSIYTQVDKYIIDELAYPIEVNWRKAIQMAETLNNDVLEVFKSKYIGTMPNHYVFTKRLAERVIIDYSGSLPCVISRPSIGTLQTATISLLLATDPVKGWVDNFNGPMAIAIGVRKGVLRVVQLDSTMHINYIPVDVVIKSLVVAAWKRGTGIVDKRDNLLHVYNIAAFDFMSVTYPELRKFLLPCQKHVPLEGAIWAPSVTYVKSLFFYRLLTLLLHVFPALLIDSLLRLSGRQPRLLKLQRTIFRSNSVLSYFMRNEWKMRNKNMLNLSDEVPADDQQDFGYAADMTYDLQTYLEDASTGAKIYLLNENMDDLSAVRSHYNRMLWIDRIAKALFGILLIWIIYKTIV